MIKAIHFSVIIPIITFQEVEELMATQEESARKEQLLQEEIKKLKSELSTVKRGKGSR